MNNFKYLPKTDLHLHSVLSAPFAAYQQMSVKRIPEPPAKFKDLKNFLLFFEEHFFPLFQNDLFLKNTTAGFLDSLIKENVIYCEPSFDLRLSMALNSTWESISHEISGIVASKNDKITVSPELGIPRPMDGSIAYDLALQALDTGIFEGIDIYDDELSKSLDDFIPVINLAKNRGLRVKIHTGEIGDPDWIRRDIDIAQPDAIQHGVRAAEDKKLMKELAELKIPLHICPASNIKLNVTDSYKAHPIKKLFDEGVQVTINSDDYAIFGVSVSEEYDNLHKESVFSTDELETIRQYGLKHFRLKNGDKKTTGHSK